MVLPCTGGGGGGGGGGEEREKEGGKACFVRVFEEMEKVWCRVLRC